VRAFILFTWLLALVAAPIVPTRAGEGVRPIVIEYGSRPQGHGAVLADGLDDRNTPSSVAVTSDGAVWFRESFTWHPRVARFAPDGSFREFREPMIDLRGPDGQPFGVGAFVADGDGLVVGGIEPGPPGLRIRRLTSEGAVGWRDARGCVVVEASFACFAGHRGNAQLLAFSNSVTRGPRGDLWFTDAVHSVVGRLAPDGTRASFTRGLTRWNSGPQFITTGPDGNMWFTEMRDRIGRVTQDGRITEFSRGIPHRASLGGIVAGPDGNLWFTLYHGMVLGSITINGAVTLYHDLVYPSDGHDSDPPAMIVRDRMGRLYYNESQAGRIARMTIAPR
jgi:streptogramin lyase